MLAMRDGFALLGVVGPRAVAEIPNQETLKSDKKTFLEQLRLINLSVIATCLLLFVGASFQSNGTLESAYDEARSIDLNARRFVDWLNSNHADVDSQLSSLFHKAPFHVYFGDTPTDFPESLAIFHVDTVSDSEQRRLSFFTEIDLSQFKGTLANFEEIWDRTSRPLSVIAGWDIGKAKTVTTPSDSGSDQRRHAEFSVATGKYKEGNGMMLLTGKTATYMEWNVPEQRWYWVVSVSSNFEPHRFVDEIPALSIDIPLEMKNPEQSLQAVAADGLKVPWPPGTFQESFPDLSRMSKGLESLSLKQLEEHLGDLRASGSESVEIFGAKLPVDFLRTWGILILFGAQLYYYLHIRQFHKVFGSEKSEPSFPWIACYESKVSRFVYCASITILPAATVIFLPLTQRSDFKNWTQMVFACCVVFASLAASLATWRET